jgi:hypothetical protein
MVVLRIKEGILKTKKDGIPRAFTPYEQEEINLILTLPPTHSNVKNLAKSLGRTTDAIYTVYHIAYNRRWLKDLLNGMKDSQDNVVTKIARAKKKHGTFI